MTANKKYARIAGEGLGLILAPICVVAIVVIYAGMLPFFLLGMAKRGVVHAFTAGDPLVP